MGAYVNTANQDKEVWLKLNGLQLTELQVEKGIKYKDIPAGKMLVVLLFNPMFTAAGICFNEREFNDFTDPEDDRAKEYYLVYIDKLYEESDLADYLPRKK